MVTQADIARKVGLDVSSVNKILNQIPGAVFHTRTKQAVFRTARELGYRFSTTSRGAMLRVLREVFPCSMTAETLASVRNMSVARVTEIKRMIGCL